MQDGETALPDRFISSLPETCEAVVVGAGPAGLLAAATLARAGAGTVVLLDRRDPWRTPVACAEAVRRDPLERISPLPIAPWIRTSVDHLVMASEGASFLWSNPGDGLIVDRARVHRDLAEHAAAAGVLCHFRASVEAIVPRTGPWRELTLRSGDHILSLRALAVIDASGPGRGFAREEGMAGGDADLEPAAFALVEGLELPDSAITLCWSPRFAPGGYAWAFPGPGGLANVGVVCGRGSGLPPREGLRRYLEHIAPGRPPGRILGGAIPCGSGSGRIAHDGLFKAGDAASMVHPLSRAGIVEAMEAGCLAGEAAAAWLAAAEAPARRRIEAGYQRNWRRRRGWSHRLAGLLKPVVAAVPTPTWDRLFASLARRPAIRTHLGTAWALGLALPGALWAARKRKS